MDKSPRALWTAGATVRLAACTGVVDGGPVRRIGFIGTAGIDDVIPVASLTAGTDHAVTIFTFGSASSTTADDVEVVERPRGFVLTPYDLVGPPRTHAGTDDLAPHEHVVLIRPEQVGTLTLFVRGLAWEDGGLVEITVAKDLTVR